MSRSESNDLRNRFLGGMSQAACTVNIITTDGAAGRAGVTVSAMASVSADTPKPTLLVCIHHETRAASKIIENGVFCVNVLKDDQAYISDIFAGRHDATLADRFDCADWVAMPSGALRVVNPLVCFDCRVMSSDRMGTHHVFFGEVGDIFIAERGSPLIYANRAYGVTAPIDTVAGLGAENQDHPSRLSVGFHTTLGPPILPELLQRMAEHDGGVSIELVEGDQRRVIESLMAGESDVALLYDRDLPEDLELVVLTELAPYVLLAEAHPLAEKPLLHPQDLAAHPMVLFDAMPSRDHFMRVLEAAGVSPRIAYRSRNLEMVRGMVSHGLGYALLATKPAMSMSYDGRALVSRSLVTDVAPSRVVMARRKGADPSAAASDFMTLCAAFFDLDHGVLSASAG